MTEVTITYERAGKWCTVLYMTGIKKVAQKVPNRAFQNEKHMLY